MSKKTTEKAKKNKKQNSKKKLDISAVAIIDNIVFSKADAWAYYKITNRAFDFLTYDGKVALMQQLTNSFNNLMGDRQESLEGHLIVTSVPIDIDLWREQVSEISSDWDRTPGFEAYMDKMTSFLKNEAYNQKVVYLGINLGKRGALNFEDLNVFEHGVKGAYDFGKEWLNKALMIPTEDIDSTEEAEFRRKEEKMGQTLGVGHLRAQKATAEELLLLIKRQMYPSMPAPYLDVDHGTRLGPGDLALEAGGVIENKYRHLKINQIIEDQELEGFRTTLTMTKFPRQMDFPDRHPFFYFIQKIGLPFTTFSRFQLHPTKKMRGELEKKRKETVDQMENMAAGANGYQQAVSGTPTSLQEDLEDSQTLGNMLDMDKTAWFEGSFFIVVETPTEELLKKFVNIVKQHYSDLEINVNQTAGDQAQLFLSQMPGDKRRMTSFEQMTNLSMLSATGFNFSSEVGDPLIGNDNEVFT